MFTCTSCDHTESSSKWRQHHTLSNASAHFRHRLTYTPTPWSTDQSSSSRSLNLFTLSHLQCIEKLHYSDIRSLLKISILKSPAPKKEAIKNDRLCVWVLL